MMPLQPPARPSLPLRPRRRRRRPDPAALRLARGVLRRHSAGAVHAVDPQKCRRARDVATCSLGSRIPEPGARILDRGGLVDRNPRNPRPQARVDRSRRRIPIPSLRFGASEKRTSGFLGGSDARARGPTTSPHAVGTASGAFLAVGGRGRLGVCVGSGWVAAIGVPFGHAARRGASRRERSSEAMASGPSSNRPEATRRELQCWRP